MRCDRFMMADGSACLMRGLNRSGGWSIVGYRPAPHCFATFSAFARVFPESAPLPNAHHALT